MADHRAYQPIKPAASRKLAKHWDDKAYRMHKQKLRSASSTVDNKPPKTYMHLQLKLKKLQMEEERLATVERDNRILLEKMSTIMRTQGRVDNRNDYSHKSLNKTKRQQELLRITHENQAILKRITAKQPHYNRRSWERDYDKSRQFQEQIARYPKSGPNTSQDFMNDTMFDEDEARDAPDLGAARHTADDSRNDVSAASSAARVEPAAEQTQPTQPEPEALNDEAEPEPEKPESTPAKAAEDEDDGPEISTKEFDRLEQQIEKDAAEGKLDSAWDVLDVNGNGLASLAEIDKWVVEQYPKLDHKPALMRAYKHTVPDAESDDPAEAYVQQEQLPTLIKRIFYYNRLFSVFEDIDTGDDRRIDEAEFKAGLSKLNLKLSAEDASKAFHAIDSNDGGQILFIEFCKWAVSQKVPVD
eukprot:TRINITY_DN7403_c0_g1_i6.p1 TRINITY_DN7403_c0_g1~~TRINITY_DN7403_c0_g1_i6.p1  ORF type:complete len:423 (+),score=111.57 TRINITY_DN7403_c0_g1_i6:26-1270(+)